MSENKKPQLTPEQIKHLMSMMQNRPQSKPRQLLIGLANKILSVMQRLTYHIDRFIKFIIKKEDIDRNNVIQTARGPILFGTYVIIIFVIFGGLWSILAPLDSAAVAIGTVIPSSKRKLIQHPQGGVVKHIYVQLGDEVKAGDKIIELDETAPRTDYETALNNYRVYQANEDRLVAERDDLSEITFSEFLSNDSYIPEVQKLMEMQRNLFSSRKEAYCNKMKALKQRHEQYDKELEALASKKTAVKKTLEFHKNHEKAMRELMAKGYAQKTKMMEAEAQAISAQSELANIDTSIAKTKQAIAQDEYEISYTQSEYTSRILQELTEKQAHRAEAKERYTRAKDNLERVVLRSPVDGTIIDMNVHTVGGVIGNNIIAEIVPKSDRLIIEARIPAREIDAVQVGLKAHVKFSAFKSRTSPSFLGTVVSLSPDTVQDRQSPQQSQETFYVSRIELDMDYFNKISKERGLFLRPGMQAEVQIVRGTRTLFRYLLDPVTDNMFKAFKEK